MCAKTAPSEYTNNATVALHEVLGISPGNFDANGAAAVIDRAIGNATRERETKARRQLRQTQAAAAAIFLVLEMSQPFAGLMQISRAPLRNALAPLGP